MTEHEKSRLYRDALQENAGKVIEEVLIQSIDVFDTRNEEEDTALYRFVNKLHINTLAPVIRSQLLFEAGQPLDPDAVAESERLLRRKNYLANAYVTLYAVCENSVTLLVVARDAWTTEPQVGFGHQGGETKSSFGVQEGNLFGTGNSFSIGYYNSQERTSVNYNFSSPHFLNTRAQVDLGYAENSDGQNKLFRLQQPFYSLRTPWAAGITVRDLTGKEFIRFREEEINEYRHVAINHEVFVGMAFDIQPESTQRLLFGYSEETDNYSQTDDTRLGIPQDRDISYPWLEYQYVENKFAVYRNIDQIQRTEDLSMGVNASLRLGYGGSNFNDNEDVLRYIGRFSDVLGVGSHHILRLNLEVDGRHYSNTHSQNSVVTGGELAYYYLGDQNNRWYASARYDVGHDLQQHEELTVGGLVGLRGYPLDYQRGNERYIFSVERRYFSDIHLFNLFRLGGLVFADVGKAWGSSLVDEVSTLADLGFGLRLTSSKAKIGNVVHVDVAFPLTQRDRVDSYQIVLTGKTAF